MKTKGQSTVEYILLVSAVIGVAIALTAGNRSAFQNKLSNTVNMTMDGMERKALNLTNTIANF